MIYKVTLETSLNFYHSCLIYDLIYFFKLITYTILIIQNLIFKIRYFISFDDTEFSPFVYMFFCLDGVGVASVWK